MRRTILVSSVLIIALALSGCPEDGTDSGMMGTDSAPGTDSSMMGTDATMGTDSSMMGTDATMGTDAAMGTDAGGPSMACTDWCTCYVATCSTYSMNLYPGGTAMADCLADCAGFVGTEDLGCRTTHCGLAMSTGMIETHCEHASGIALCN